MPLLAPAEQISLRTETKLTVARPLARHDGRSVLHKVSVQCDQASMPAAGIEARHSSIMYSN